jgi:hypothetical protein
MATIKPAGKQGLYWIQKVVHLVKEVNCVNYAIVSEVAKEMGVKKTDLMQFIDDNPKLFKVVPYIGGITSNAKAKNLGLVIKTVYNSAEENPETEEWLEVKKKAWEKKIHIGERTYYDCHEYWLIPEDSILYKEGEYRNTPEKIKELVDAGVIEKVTKFYGSFGDCYSEEVFNFDDDVKKAIEDYGWTTDFPEEE